MRSVIIFFSIFVLFCHSTFSGNSKSTDNPTKNGRVFSKSDEVIPGVVIVKFKQDIIVNEFSKSTNSNSLNNLFERMPIFSLSRMFGYINPATADEISNGKIDLSRIYYLYIDHDADPREIAQELDHADGIEYAEPKYMHYIETTPNDPMLSTQSSAFTRMNVINGWAIGKGDTSVAIATVDGGTFWQHEDLFGNLWINKIEDINGNGRFDLGPPPLGDEDGIDQGGNGFVDDVVGWNFTNNTNNPRGLSSTPSNANHGTNTASNFGAVTHNGIGMAGTSWNCRLISVCASATTDNGVAFGYEGIAYAFANGAKVINCSWGRAGGYSLFEQDLINAAVQAGALVVASSGNGGSDNIGDNNDLFLHYPSGYKNVLGVGATNSTSDAKTSFSNYGVTVPVYAPGSNILSANNSGGYSSLGISGTSFSSPLVAGLAGLVKVKNPGWTPKQVAAQIRVTSDSIDSVNPSFSGNMGRGRVNFARALTESHPGIDIVSVSILTTKGSNLFLQGDTIVVKITMENLLPATANNLSIVATSSDASFSVLSGTANVLSLIQGERVTLPDLRFRVGTITASKDVILKLSWVSNVNARDAFAYRITIFPSLPLWATQASPTQTSLHSVKAVDRNIVWAVGGNGSATMPTVIKTTDGGSNWISVTGNLTNVDLYCVTALDGNRAWVGTGGSVNGDGKIFATTDGGSTWNLQTYPSPLSPFMNGVWMFDNGIGYAQGDPAGGNKFVVLKTTDFGTTWNHLANEPTGASGEAGWNNSFWWTNQNYGWFGTNKSKIWRTTDGGTTWLSGSTSTNSYVVAFKDNMNGIAGHQSGVLRVTTNGGSTWSSVTSPTTSNITGAAYLPGTTSAWISITTNPYRSTNGGTSWTIQSLYPFSGSLQHISFVDTSFGWAVTSNGEVLKYQVPGVTSVDPDFSVYLPQKFELGQNYPNPFNPVTTINYQLSMNSYVNMKVYNILGVEVATLVDGYKEAGYYSVCFDASSVANGLASGLYFYRMQAGSFVDIKKLILMK